MRWLWLSLACVACTSARFPTGAAVDVTGGCSVFLPVVVDVLEVAPPAPSGSVQSPDGYGYELAEDHGTSVRFHFASGRLVALDWAILERPDESGAPHHARRQPGDRLDGTSEVPDGAFVGGRWEPVKVTGKSGQVTELSVRFERERVEVRYAGKLYPASCDWDPVGQE